MHPCASMPRAAHRKHASWLHDALVAWNALAARACSPRARWWAWSCSDTLGRGSGSASAPCSSSSSWPRLGPFRDSLPAEVPAVVLVLPVVVAALIGGRLAAVAVAVRGRRARSRSLPRRRGRLRRRVRRGGPRRPDRVPRRGCRRRWPGRHRGHGRPPAGRGRGGTRASPLEELDGHGPGLLRSVSHDLRTPLATIRAVATDLRSGTAYDDPTRDELLGLVGDRGRAARPDRGQPAQPEPHRSGHAPAGPPGRRPGRAGRRPAPTALQRVLSGLAVDPRRRARPAARAGRLLPGRPGR